MPGPRGGGRVQKNIKAYTTRRQQERDNEDAESSMADPAFLALANPAIASLSPDMQNLRSVLMDDMKELIGNMFEKTLSSLNKSLGDIRAAMGDHEQRIVDLEEGNSDFTDRVVVLESLCERLIQENESLVERMESAENRSRRFNLRVTNIAEKSEQNDPIKFMSTFFKDVLGDSVYPAAPILDLAHRIGRERSDPTAKPRVMIVRFHYFQDKARALKADRNKLIWRGRKVLFFPDYTAATAKLRASFSKVKSLLYAKKVQFRLVFPAVLKVEFKNKTYVFKTAADAMQFYNQHVAGFAVSKEGDGAADSDGTGGAANPEGDGDAAGFDGEEVAVGGKEGDEPASLRVDAAGSNGDDNDTDVEGDNVTVTTVHQEDDTIGPGVGAGTA